MSFQNPETPEVIKAGGRKVAIIGRPNVGKSTLFNLLTRTRKAVVKNEPGVTRDILVEPACWWGQDFEVIDTGGLTEAQDAFSLLIREQVLRLVETFDILIVVMDGRIGLVPEDREIVRIAKESGKPFVIVANKIDRMHEADLLLSEFYEFSVDVLPTSFERQSGVDDLVEWVLARLPEENVESREGIRLTIVGKPNVGKSSMCNFLLKDNRMLVSDIAGTTVDAVEEQFYFDGREYILVDTAGLRRQAKRKDGVEFLSAFKAHEAINKADVVLLMVDATVGPTDQDAKMMSYITDHHKGVILVANKSDKAKKEIEGHRQWFKAHLAREFHFSPDIPICFTSAQTGAGVKDMMNLVYELWQKLHLKIPTSKLNKFFYDVIRQAPSPVYGTKNVKFYYLTQTQQVPPSFIAFANEPKGVTPSYRRFISKRLKTEFGLEGVPIRIFVMKSGS